MRVYACWSRKFLNVLRENFNGIWNLTKSLNVLFLHILQKVRSSGNKLYDLCEECDINFFHEYLFGQYCIDATKRWYHQDRCSATLREVYVAFKTHYNRRLNVYSQEKHNTMKLSKMKTTPRCMCDGSLKHALTWWKYHMECHEYFCNLHGYQLITESEVDVVVHKDYENPY